MTVLDLADKRNIHSLAKRIDERMRIILEIIDILAICTLIIILVNLSQRIVERLLCIIFIGIYNYNVRASVVFSVLNENVSLVGFLNARWFLNIQLNLNDIVDQLVLVPQTEHLVQVRLSNLVSVIGQSL